MTSINLKQPHYNSANTDWSHTCETQSGIVPTYYSYHTITNTNIQINNNIEPL
jgi:hypothetical protein